MKLQYKANNMQEKSLNKDVGKWDGRHFGGARSKHIG
jgi:hypothetical protein